MYVSQQVASMKPSKTMIFDLYNCDRLTMRRGRGDITFSLQAQPFVSLQMDGKNPSSKIFGPQSGNSDGVRAAAVVSAAHKRRPCDNLQR